MVSPPDPASTESSPAPAGARFAVAVEELLELGEEVVLRPEVAEVLVADKAVFVDVDTPELLQKVKAEIERR